MRSTGRTHRWTIALSVCIVLVAGAAGCARQEVFAVPKAKSSVAPVDAPPAGEQEALDAGEDVDRYVRRHASEDYAGSYLKQEGATTVLWVGFVKNVSHHRRNILARSEDPDRLRFFEARNTLQELEALGERTVTDTRELVRAGVSIAASGPDEERNRLWLGLVRLTPRVRAELEHRYGADMLVLEETGLYTPLTGSTLE